MSKKGEGRSRGEDSSSPGLGPNSSHHDWRHLGRMAAHATGDGLQVSRGELGSQIVGRIKVLYVREDVRVAQFEPVLERGRVLQRVGVGRARPTERGGCMLPVDSLCGSGWG